MTLFEQTPLFLAALLLAREDDVGTHASRLGVWWTLQNRMKHPQWPHYLVGVILEHHLVKSGRIIYQFSSFQPGDPNVTRFPFGEPQWVDCCDIVEGSEPDPTSGAVFYESFPDDQIDEVRKTHPWFALDKLTVQIDKLRFYRL